MDYPFFPYNELKCPCCGEMKMNMRFMDRLINVRTYADFPMPITSAYRCEKHNKAVGGKKTSAHLLGRAVDINVYHNNVYKIMSIIVNYGLTGVGLSQHGQVKKRFIHLDDLEETPNRIRPTVWTY